MSIVSVPNNYSSKANASDNSNKSSANTNSKKINPYLYSFSGSDTLVSICFEASPENEVKLESVNTISISIHEQKTPVRRLGHAGPVGFTSSMRVIGGSIILTAVNGHPLQALVSSDLGKQIVNPNPGTQANQSAASPPANINQSYGSVLANRKTKAKVTTDFFLPFEKEEIDRANYLGNNTSLGYFKGIPNKGMPVCTVLPPMRIRLLFVSEYQNNVVPGYGEIILRHVNFVSENIVMSVNNMVTEFVLQFVAADVNEFQFTESDFDTVNSMSQVNPATAAAVNTDVAAAQTQTDSSPVEQQNVENK